MKKGLIAILALAPMLLMAAGCSASEDEVEVLRILNCEDYIYEAEDTDETMLTLFTDYMKEQYGRDIEIIYDTFDTNETMMNELKTGKSDYDLVVPSDYTIQKMIAEDMLIPFDDGEHGSLNQVPHYQEYASTYLQEQLRKIKINIPETSELSGKGYDFSNFAKGYMWGTLGLIFNPDSPKYDHLLNEEEEHEQIFEDFRNWDVLWNPEYKNTFSIKDSMRDTYAATILYTYRTEFEDAKTRYEEGVIDVLTYNDEITAIFNRCAPENIEDVKKEMLKLKANAFGFEVDSGKEDIKTGRVGANLAWSGDAVYSMDGAEEMANPKYLYYSVPETGANLWFDGWVMLKNANKELAQKFVDFVSVPENAALNMECIGYTPFIAGDSIVDLVRDWYDVRPELIEQLSKAGIEIDYSDLETYEDVEHYYNEYQTLLENNEATTELEFDIADVEEVHLDYFFDGTLSEEYELYGSTFFAYEYLPFEEETGNISVGRQFFCQFPDQRCITRGAVMADFGESNTLVLKMWIDVRATNLPIWALILLIVEISAILVLVFYFVFKKQIKKRLRKSRLKENK